MALFDQLEHVEPGGAAHRPGDVAGRKIAGRADEELGQPFGGAHAELAAVFALGCIGKLTGQRTEILTLARPVGRALGAGFECLDLLGRSLLGHQHEDVRQIEFEAGQVAAALLLTHELVDIVFAHPNAAVDLAFVQLLQQYLVAQLVA